MLAMETRKHWRRRIGRIIHNDGSARPMTEALNDKQREAILGTIPAGKLGTGEDVAAGVVYLASREAGYVTGQTLHINGGMAMI